MSMILRPSVDPDLPRITAIYAHAVIHGTASFELDPPDQAEMAAAAPRWWRAASPSGGGAGRDVVGYAYGRVPDASSLPVHGGGFDLCRAPHRGRAPGASS